MAVSLVTGGAGFIGSHVGRCCVARGDTVVVLDDLSGGYRELVPQGAEFVQGDVTDELLVEGLFAERGFDYVYHLAAYAAEGLSHFIRRYNYRNNVIGSVNLINAAVNHDVRCFVFASSIAVYGENQLPMSEDLVPAPEDPYGIAKYAVELDLAAAARMFGLPSIVFRPHNVYGEGQNIADRYRNVLGIFMNQVMRGEPMSVFGDGEQTRAFSYIDDVAPIIAGSVDVPEAYGQTFNVGGDTPYTVNQLAEVVAAAFGVEPSFVHLPARREVLHAFSSHDRQRAVFGHSEPITLEEGVRRMAEWAKSHGPMEPSRFDSVEIERNLPPSWAAIRTQ
jgi:UDP-glucose 4-epimerase